MRRETGFTIILLVVIALSVATGGVGGTDRSDSVRNVAVTPEDTRTAEIPGLEPVRKATAAGDNALVRKLTFERRPDRPGTISLKMTFEIPDQVVELRTGIPSNGTVTGTNGFERTEHGNYTWNGDTERPTVSMTYSVNRTGAYHVRPAVTDQEPGSDPGLTFADTDDWTIAAVPSASVYWTAYQSSPTVTFDRKTEVSGTGVAGDRMVYLGPHSKTTREIEDQTVTLVVPGDASLTSNQDTILDSMAAASPHLPPSPVDRSVVIAAPTSVDWGPYGLAEGGDTWIRADEPISVPGNVWLHEFVHLRQDFRTETEARWIREGMPEYYAAYLTLEQGRIDFGAFADHLDRATQSRYADTILSDPASWESLGNYVKGGLVYGTIDRQVRLESTGEYAARNLFVSMNDADSRIDHAFIKAQIREMTDRATVDGLNPYIQTAKVPAMWSRSDHGTAFGTDPPDITVSIDGQIELTGPYRNRSVESVPRIVPGETLSFPVSVSNDGEATGTYETSLQVDGTSVTSHSGTLPGGAADSFSFDFVAKETGTRSIAIGPSSVAVTVVEPADPIVTNMSLSATDVEPGDTIVVTAEITNPESWPANGTLTTEYAGDHIATWSLALAPDQTVTRTVEITPIDPGAKQITVGSTSVRIQVDSPDTVAPTESPTRSRGEETTTHTVAETTASETPGFTVPLTLVVFIVMGYWRAMGR